MKKNLLIVSLSLLLFISCGSDSDETQVQGVSDPTTFLPLANGNYWTYDVDNDANNPGPLGRDSLYVANDTVVNSVTYKKMKTRAIPTGFFSTSLRNNAVKIDQFKLLINGTFNFDFGLTTPISIALNDFIFFKENAATNEVLSTTSGTISQTIQNIPLVIDYKLSSVANGSLPLYILPNGDDYTGIRKTKVVLNLKITTQQTISGIPVTVTIMPAQDVIVSTQYYTGNTGMIYANTVLNYQLNTIPGVTLPIPASGNQTQEEFLKTFVAN